MFSVFSDTFDVINDEDEVVVAEEEEEEEEEGIVYPLSSPNRDGNKGLALLGRICIDTLVTFSSACIFRVGHTSSPGIP